MKRSRGERIFNVFNLIFLTCLTFVFILPVWHVAMASISQPFDLAKNVGLVWKPLGEVTFKGYEIVFHNASILRSYANTILYVTAGTLFGVLISILAAYVLSRKNLYFGGFLTGLVMFTMIFNGGLIPTYMVVRNLGMLDTIWAMIFPTAVSAYNIIVLRTGFASVPDSLIEAAEIDGASQFRVLWQIVVPVSKATIAVIVLFYAVTHWNEWFTASIYLRDRDLYPLQLTLREIVINSDTSAMSSASDAGDVNKYLALVKYACIMISIVPMMVLYPFVQKYFVQGVMIGSVKG